ncbi:MAG: DUF1801 domain-containing protein, partial [Parvularculaceae bacterium]
LEKLRRAIKAAAPDAEECFSYGLPAFRSKGVVVAGFGASANHCSYYPMSGSVTAALKSDLKGYETSKGAIRFSADKPLPAALVKKLVKERFAESKAKGGAKKTAPATKKSATAAKATKAPAKSGGAQFDPAVAAFLKALDHPLKKEIEAARLIILGASPTIREGIKWNAPSFKTTDWFATLNLRSKESVQLIFHTGAKVKESATKGLAIADPKGLLKWLAKDRAMVTLGAGAEIAANRRAFEALVRAWIMAM